MDASHANAAANTATNADVDLPHANTPNETNVDIPNSAASTAATRATDKRTVELEELRQRNLAKTMMQGHMNKIMQGNPNHNNDQPIKINKETFYQQQKQQSELIKQQQMDAAANLHSYRNSNVTATNDVKSQRKMREMEAAAMRHSYRGKPEAILSHQVKKFSNVSSSRENLRHVEGFTPVSPLEIGVNFGDAKNVFDGGPKPVSQILGLNGDGGGGNYSPDAGSEVIEERIGIPNDFTGYIIGRGGASITSMQRKSGCRVQIQSEHELEPGTTQRIITLTGASPEAVSMCRGIIEEMVQERARLLNDNRGGPGGRGRGGGGGGSIRTNIPLDHDSDSNANVNVYDNVNSNLSSGEKDGMDDFFASLDDEFVPSPADKKKAGMTLEDINIPSDANIEELVIVSDDDDDDDEQGEITHKASESSNENSTESAGWVVLKDEEKNNVNDNSNANTNSNANALSAADFTNIDSAGNETACITNVTLAPQDPLPTWMVENVTASFGLLTDINDAPPLGDGLGNHLLQKMTKKMQIVLQNALQGYIDDGVVQLMNSRFELWVVRDGKLEITLFGFRLCLLFCCMQRKVTNESDIVKFLNAITHFSYSCPATFVPPRDRPCVVKSVINLISPLNVLISCDVSKIVMTVRMALKEALPRINA